MRGEHKTVAKATQRFVDLGRAFLRNRPPPPKRPAPEKDSKDDKVSSSSTGVKTKEDLLKEQSRLKDKATGVDKDVRAPTKKTQYFLTMNGESHGGGSLMSDRYL